LLSAEADYITVTALESERASVDAALLLDAPPFFSCGRGGFGCHLLSLLSVSSQLACEAVVTLL